MKYHCIKIFGSRIKNNDSQVKSFKTLKAFEKWIQNDTGTAHAMTFRHGDTIVYKYRYKNGVRRKIGNELTPYDYKWFNKQYPN